MKGSKLAGVLVASAIVGLSLGDALTGHGIKGNKNLNPIVVGDGSSTSNSSSSSSSSSSSGSGSSGSGSSSSSTNSDNSSDDNKPKLQHHNTKNYCLITVYGNDGKPTENHPGNFYSCIPGDGPCTPVCVAL